MIELTDVSKVFTLTKDQRKIVGESELRPKSFTAVDSISFKCESGSVFALIGPVSYTHLTLPTTVIV